MPENAPPELRDVKWLHNRLNLLIQNHFADVAQGYPIVVGFGARARYRLGSISAKGGKCYINVNRLFSDPEVPLYVVDETLAHEFAHYAHGYGSGLPKLYENPHKGGVIDLELAKRGLGAVQKQSEEWRKKHWAAFYKSRCEDIVEVKTLRGELREARWDAFLNAPNRRPAEELLRLYHAALKMLEIPRAPEIEVVGWLCATTRQQILSCYYPKIKTLHIHGLLADRRVPENVLVFELAYWILRTQHSANWERIYALMLSAGMEKATEEALAWRKRSWTRFRNSHHPLKTT